MTRATRFVTSLILIALAWAIWAPTAHAQPVLVEASPPPDAVLPVSPERITLKFDRLLADRGTAIRVFDADGERMDQQDTLVNPANRYEVSVTLPPLIEGIYTIEYNAAALGSSTLAVGRYTITIALPPPRLALLSPVNGQAFQTGDIPLQMAVDFFDFGLFDNRIRVYVDGELRDEVKVLEYTLEDLPPGVHEIRVVLTRLGDSEFLESEIVVYIAVAQFDEELAGREEAARAAPDPGLQLSPLETAGLVALTLVLLGIGFWLGRQPAHKSSQ